MSKFGTIKEVFELCIIKRKFYMFPIIVYNMLKKTDMDCIFLRNFMVKK